MALTIDQYLQVVPGITFSDLQIQRILMKSGIVSGTIASEVSEQSRDLAEADVWYSASMMTGGGSYSKKINNRQISETQSAVSDKTRALWLNAANALRAKWGLLPYTDNKQIYDATMFWQ